ncbi:MAG TPA: selenium-dependent molybdenum cofactor biosynthesis protein YqeB [Syntrophorhabdaceae bacterium]|nr:selenium-dependent molybdenum cofactor biosynthesis protein YqeB [Syntrophorhabdaceae bacterium]
MRGNRITDVKIVIKGAGEMASGIAHRLYMANFKKIIMTEIERPISVRRFVAFSEAVYEKTWTVEGVTGELFTSLDEVEGIWARGSIGVIVDPNWSIIKVFKPYIVIDAIMAKKNLGTKKDEAPIVIGVGPGFTAPDNCHVVVESNRGHNLGRVFYQGSAEAHTGVPGPVMGLTTERVLRSPHAGMVKHVMKLGDEAKKGDIVMYINDTPVTAPIDGILRGLIREIYVTDNEKIGDIDPRGKKEYCFTISEKARAIGGGVLEAVMHFMGNL